MSPRLQLGDIMNKIEDLAIEVIEEMSKTVYSIGTFVAKVFYKVYNIEALKNGLDAYMLERFKRRLENFTYEHNKLSDNEKQAFYEDLKSNKQNLNYLYEFVEKARTTTFDLHAKILARLSVDLIKNKKLNYYESSLIVNINSLTDNDIMLFYKQLINLKMTPNENNLKVWLLNFNEFEEEIAIRKFINIGIITEDRSSSLSFDMQKHPFKFYKTDYTDKLLEILDEIIT